MVIIASGNPTLIQATTLPKPVGSVPLPLKTAVSSPTISSSNSAAVTLSSPIFRAAPLAPVLMTVSSAILAYKSAINPDDIAALAPFNIKDASTTLTNNLENRDVLMAMAFAGKISSIAFTDTTAPKFTFDRAAISGSLDGKDNPSPAVMMLQKITTKYSLAITSISASDAATIKPPVANATLSFAVSDNVGGVSANLVSLQTLGKAKALIAINVATDPISPTKPVLTLSAADLKSAPDALKLLKGNFDLTITGVAAADASKTAGAADVILKAAGSTSLAKVAISDTAANIAKNITSIELTADAGRLTEITVSDGKELILTEAQVLAANDTVKAKFTSPTKLVVTDITAKDVIANINSNSTLSIKEIGVPLTLPNGGTFNNSINKLADGSLTWGNYNTVDGKIRSFIINSSGELKDITPEGAKFCILHTPAIAGNVLRGDYMDANDKMHPFILNKDGSISNILKNNDDGFINWRPIMSSNNSNNSAQNEPVLMQLNYGLNGSYCSYINGKGEYKEISIVGASMINIRDTNNDGSLIWGDYFTGSSSRSFSINKEGIFKDITPDNSSNLAILKISSDGSRMWGQYNDLDGHTHACMFSSDGKLKDLSPQGSINSSIDGFTESGSHMWGQYRTADERNRGFIIDKTGILKDITPVGASSSFVSGISSDGSLVWGKYQLDNSPDFRGFVITSDGKFTDITPSGSKYFNFINMNNSDMVAGTFSDSSDKSRAFNISKDGKFNILSPDNASMVVLNPPLFGSNTITCNYKSSDGQFHSRIINQKGIIADFNQQSGTNFMVEGNSPDGSLIWGRFQDPNFKQSLFSLTSSGIFKEIKQPDYTIMNFTGTQFLSRQFAWGNYMKLDGTQHCFILNQSGDFKEYNTNGVSNFAVDGVSKDGSVAWGQINDVNQNSQAFLLTKEGEFKIITPQDGISSKVLSYPNNNLNVNASYVDINNKLHLLSIANNNALTSLLSTNNQLSLSREEVKDTSANIQTNLKNLQSAVKSGILSKITMTDKGTITLSYADMQSNLDAIKAISGTYKLVVTEISVADALTLKAPATGVTLSLSVKDTSAAIAANMDKLEILAKAKSLGTITISDIPSGGSPGSVLSLSTKQFIAAPTAIKALQLPYQLRLTNALATDVLKLSTTPNLSSIQITDTAANIVKNLTALEAAAKVGKIASVTVSDGKSLDMSLTQIKASETFLNVTFTGNAVVEAKEVSAAEFATLEGSIEDNQSLVLGKQSIKDTAANIQAKLDQLDAAVEAGSATTASGAFMLGNIAVSDKGTITVTNSTFLKDLDALKVVSGAYKLNVTDINVTDALAIKAPSKDATLSLTIKDTASNIAANWDKLQALVKAKTLTNITLTDGSSSLLTMTAAQLKANADVLKVVTGDYKLSVTGVAAADVAKTLTTKNIYSVEVKDTVANILKNLPSIKTAVTAAKIQSVIITDATNPTLSIADIFTLTTTLPNVTLAAGVKFNVKDTASNVVAHARYDIADVIKNAGSIALLDKTPPNLTLADATTLKGLTGLAAGTKYNVADGGAVIAAQAALSGEKVLADAASVVVNKNFTITEAKAVSAIKSLAKGSAYSINDTAANILTQSALAGETILGKANAVNVVDTSANILAKLDQLQVLAKAGKIADIKFTDAPSGALPLTDAQMLNNAEAIGKIISQRTLPTLTITPPKKPEPIGPVGPVAPVTFDLPIPAGSTNVWINGYNANSEIMWGGYIDAQSKFIGFTIKSDGTNFKSGNFSIWGANQNGSLLWGYTNGYLTAPKAFTINSDGSNYKDIGYTIKGINNTGTMLWGASNQGLFTINIDGSNFNIINSNSNIIDGNFMDGSIDEGKFFNEKYFININNNSLTDLSNPPKNGNLINSNLDYSKFYGNYKLTDGTTIAYSVNSNGENYIDLVSSKQFASNNTQFINSMIYIGGQSKDGSRIWGVDGIEDHGPPFSVKPDGSGFINLKPLGAKYTYTGGSNEDGNIIWGDYEDINGKSRVYKINIDGTGFSDLSPPESVMAFFGTLNADKTGSWNTYQTADLKWHSFYSKF